MHKIHEWLNFTLNDSSKSVNIFNVSSSRRFEKIENEIKHQINENKKQSDHTNVNWKNWICEIFACSQNSGICSFELFLRDEQTDVKICNNELLPDAKNKWNFADNKWRDEKLSPFNDYFHKFLLPLPLLDRIFGHKCFRRRQIDGLPTNFRSNAATLLFINHLDWPPIQNFEAALKFWIMCQKNVIIF